MQEVHVLFQRERCRCFMYSARIHLQIYLVPAPVLHAGRPSHVPERKVQRERVVARDSAVVEHRRPAHGYGDCCEKVALPAYH